MTEGSREARELLAAECLYEHTRDSIRNDSDHHEHTHVSAGQALRAIDKALASRPSPDTSDAVEVVADALAFPRIFSEQSGPVQDYWRGKARAAISSLATIRAGVVEEAAMIVAAEREKQIKRSDEAKTETFQAMADYSQGVLKVVEMAIRRLADGEKSSG